MSGRYSMLNITGESLEYQKWNQTNRIQLHCQCC